MKFGTERLWRSLLQLLSPRYYRLVETNRALGAERDRNRDELFRQVQVSNGLLEQLAEALDQLKFLQAARADRAEQQPDAQAPGHLAPMLTEDGGHAPLLPTVLGLMPEARASRYQEIVQPDGLVRRTWTLTRSYRGETYLIELTFAECGGAFQWTFWGHAIADLRTQPPADELAEPLLAALAEFWEPIEQRTGTPAPVCVRTGALRRGAPVWSGSVVVNACAVE